MISPKNPLNRYARLSNLIWVVIHVFPISSCWCQTWQHYTNLPEPNGGFLAAIENGNIYIAGGANWKKGEKHILDTIWKFNLQDEEWENIGVLPNGFTSVGGGIREEGLFLIGRDSTGAVRTYLVDINGEAEVIELNQLPKELGYSGSAKVGNALFLVGGAALEIGDKETQAYPQLIKYSLLTKTYYPLADYINGPVMMPTVIGRNNGLFVFGGCTYSKEKCSYLNRRESGRYDFSSEIWSRIADFPYAGRGMMSLNLNDDLILVGGGYNDMEDAFSDVAYVYDVKEDTYCRTIDFPIPAMATVISDGKYIYMMGGEDGFKSRSVSVFRIPKAAFLREKGTMP